MTVRISRTQYAAGSQIFRADGNGLTPAMRGLAQSLARIAASTVADLVDNSGGQTADGTIEAIGSFVPAALGSSDAAQKAELEAGFANTTDALKELIAQINLLNARVPALTGALVDNIVGTAADGTIAAIDVSYTGVGTAMASAAGANLVLTRLKNAVAQLALHVNKLAVACGSPAVVDLSGGTPTFSLAFADIPEGTGTAASGADATAANAIVKAADASAVMQKLANAVKELATKLNALGDATGGVAATVAV